MLALAAVVVLTGIGLAGLFGLAQSDAGRERLAAWLAPLLSTATGYRVEIVGISRGLPARIGVDRMTLADAEGVWLTLERLAVVWNPAALLQGRLAVSALEADRLDVARLPAAEPETARKTSTKFSISRPPFDVQVDRLAVGTLVLGRSILGEPARLGVAARLGARTGEVINTDVAIVRTDGGEGRIEAEAQLNPTTRRLRVDAKVNEAANGLVVRLLGLAPYPPLSLSLTGDGPLEDWRGAVNLEAAGLVSLSGELSAAAAATGTRIGFDGRGDWRGEMPAVLRPALEDGIHIAVGTHITANGPLVVDALRLEGRDLSADATARYDPETSGIAAQANVTVGPGALAAQSMAGYRMASIGAVAVVSGRLDAIEGAVAGTISGLTGPAIESANLAWRASLAPTVPGGSAVRVTVDGMAVTATDPKLSALLGPTPTALLEGRLSATGDALDVQTARITAAAAELSASGRLALDEAPSDLRIEVGFADLTKLQPLIGLRPGGEVSLVAQVYGPLVAGAAAAHVDGAAKNLKTGNNLADAAIGARPSLAGTLSFDPATGLDISDFRLAGANVRIAGEAHIDPAFQTFAASGEATVADLAPLARATGVEASGALRLEAKGTGPLADPDARLRIILSKNMLAGLTVEAGEIVVAATGLGSRPAGDLRATLQNG